MTTLRFPASGSFTGPTGPAPWTHRGAWVSTTAYSGGVAGAPDDVVTYNGSLWRALRASTGVTPVEGADWTLLVSKGDTGSGANADTLDGIDSTGFAPAAHVGSRDGHPLATTTLDGMMAAADKGKLDRALDVETSQRVVYVSPTGSDTTGNGTSANRWKTIQHAVDQARTFMQPQNTSTAYKIVCAAGTYDAKVVVPPNLFGTFRPTGLGGIWIASESGVAADVVLTSTDATSAITCFGSTTLSRITVENDVRGLLVQGSPTTFVYIYQCTFRRRSIANGGTAAMEVQFGRVFSESSSSVAGQLFTYGLSASYAGVVQKYGVQPAGATANEYANGGVIR